MVLGVYIEGMVDLTTGAKDVREFINNLQKGVTFSIKHAHRNGDTSNDVKSRFIQDGVGVFKFTRSIPSLSELGYYQLVINVTNGKGSSLDIPLNLELVGLGLSHGGEIDASAVTYGVNLIAGTLDSNIRILKTGTGDDILKILGGATGSVVNGGSGDNTYRFSYLSSSNFSVHNFDLGDKIQVDTRPGVRLSVYENESDVVPTVGYRYFYVKETGKLYCDDYGDAVWDATNSRIDLKTGYPDQNKLVTVLYSDEGTTFYQDLKASQLEYKNF